VLAAGLAVASLGTDTAFQFAAAGLVLRNPRDDGELWAIFALWYLGSRLRPRWTESGQFSHQCERCATILLQAKLPGATRMIRPSTTASSP